MAHADPRPQQLPPWGRAAAGAARGAVRLLRDWALPPRCATCGTIVAADDALCLPCWSALERFSAPACACCDRPFAAAQGEGALCGACIASAPPWNQARAAVRYGEIARTLVIRLKYGRRVALARLMARLMATRVPEIVPQIAEDAPPSAAPADVLLVPVPLHRWRLWWRGFNQSVLLGRALLRALPPAQQGRNMHLLPDALNRTRATRPLRGMSARQRSAAIKGAFAVNPAHAERLRGAHVMLLDDVWTSGATASECARVLRRAGAAHVTLLTFARVLSDAEAGTATPPHD